MLPAQLKPEDFNSYPPQARQLCVEHLSLFRQLPLAFLPLLLREVFIYDWKFPVERQDLQYQLQYLASKPASELQRTMAPFAGLRLSPNLEQSNWVANPGRFSEDLTAHLWATHQIDTFRTAAVDYVDKFDASKPKETPAIPRWGIILIGQGVAANTYPLFGKLQHQGVYFRNVDPANGKQAIFDAVARRTAAHPVPFAHWYIDGGDGEQGISEHLTCISYNALAPVRESLLREMRKVMQPGGGGPELLRTKLAEIAPAEVGMHGDPVLNRFQLSLLTEGSGTQIFSTTFVQWSAREALRRAQPVTLLARFAPRRREQSMKEIILGIQDPHEPDPQGSLIDADMGAYYTWINAQRLSGAEQSRFLVWFEAGREAVAIGPAFPRDAQQNRPVDIPTILHQFA